MSDHQGDGCADAHHQSTPIPLLAVGWCRRQPVRPPPHRRLRLGCGPEGICQMIRLKICQVYGLGELRSLEGPVVQASGLDPVAVLSVEAGQ